MIEVKDLDELEVFRFYGRQVVSPIKGYAARQGLRTVALGGLMLGAEGRVWGFLDFKPGHRLRAMYRYTLKLLEWAEHNSIPEIYVTRDDTIATSQKLLARSGFSPTGETAAGLEIWVWKNKKVNSNG